MEDWHEIGRAYDANGEYDKAVDAYKKALEINPNDGFVWNNLGLAYESMGEYIKSIEAYKKALEIDRTNVTFWDNLGFTYQSEGEYDDAIYAFTTAIDINNMDIFAWKNLGYAYICKTEYDKAIDAYKNAFGIDPLDGKVWSGLESAYLGKLPMIELQMSQGKVEEAISDLEDILDLAKEGNLIQVINTAQEKLNRCKETIDGGWAKQDKKLPSVSEKITLDKISVLGDIQILRGGDWKIEGNQSVFYYKVKVKNDSQFVITNIQILLTSTPRGLIAQSDRYKIESLKPNTFESPTFKLIAKESCVGDIVEGIVTFTDPLGKLQTSPIKPFEICYVCNLLTPKEVSREVFKEKTEHMEEKNLIIESDLDISDLEGKIEDIVTKCNFALLQKMQEGQSESFRTVEAFAQGLYDKQDVAISVAVKKVEDGSQLVVKAMSDRAEKVTDLLKDFSIKLDDIKSDTELIKEYTSQIEDLMDKTEDLEAFLRKHLASDFEKIRFAWQDYKDGKINKKGLIKNGIKVIGKRFIKIFVNQI